MSALRRVVAVARTALLLAFVAGGVRGAFEYARRDYVCEFQAGDLSPWSERLLAIAQRATFEAFGFGLLAAGIAVAALCVLPFERWIGGRAALHAAASASADASTSGDTRYAASCVRVGASCGLWIAFGAWLAREALPFLELREVLLLDAAGLAAGTLLYVVFEALASRLPGRPHADPLGRALASALALSLGLRLAWLALTHEPRGALQWGLAAACAPGALVLARIGMGNLCAGLPLLVAWWTREPRVPRALRLALGLLLGACSVATALRFDLGSNAPSAGDVRAEALAPRAATLASAAADAPNVVFITVDTLRADALSCHGYARPTTPFLDSIAAAGTRCADAISAAAWTKPSTGTLLTGLYPSRHGALYHGSQLLTPKGESTLAEAFQSAGYVTAGFVTNPNIKAVFGFDRGFDRWFDAAAEDTLTLSALRDAWIGGVVHEFTRYQFNWKYANDIDTVNAQVLPWLAANRERRFFLYLHYIDPHEPYAPPPAYERDFEQDHGFPLFNQRKRLVGRDLYDAEVRYTDDGLRRLVEQLRALGLHERTLLVVTSDHGEEFFEHGALGHGFNLFQEVVHVPLILHGPGVAAGRVIAEPIATRDLPATLLDLAGSGLTRLGDGHSFAAAVRAAPTGAANAASAASASGATAAAPAEGAASRPAGGPYFLESEFGENEDDIRSFVFNGVRDGSFKLVLTERDKYRPVGPGGRHELYDLATDPLEQRDLLHDPAQRARIEKLVHALRDHSQFLESTGFRHVPSLLLSPEIRANLKALGYL
jgi:arylsulfatase A-like enzyme